MSRNPIEIIVLKQFASCLAIPIFVIGPTGHLLYFNESAEPLLGQRFDEVGDLGLEEWGQLAPTFDEFGEPFKPEKRPLVLALNERRPIHQRLTLQRFDGRSVRVEGTAIPLVATDDRLLGALAVFWEDDRPEIPEPSPTPAPLASFQHPVEMILARRLSRTLSTAVFLADSDGRLLYFNPAAEAILGGRFHTLDGTAPSALYERFDPRDEAGCAIDPDDHPLSIARRRREPVNARSEIRGLDGIRRTIDVTALPLVGQSGRLLGALGIFWEVDTR
jgi:PAS domain-containing protein